MWCLQLSALKRKKKFFGGKATFRKNRIERKKIQVKKKREGERERVKSVREKEEEYFFFLEEHTNFESQKRNHQKNNIKDIKKIVS